MKSLERLEQETEEDIEGEQHEREDDSAPQAAPRAHPFSLFFLSGLLLGCFAS